MADEAIDKKECVLLIDDSKLIRKAAAKMLAKEFEVLLAEDGEDGWNALVNNPAIQLVFCDLLMPKMDGYQLLEKLRSSEDERISQLPVIIVTGADNADDIKEKAYELGATDFISKPFNPTDIKARAHAHVSHQRQTKSLLEQVNIDGLTGLLNKQGFESRLAEHISFISRHQQDLAVMLVEVDDYRALFEKVGRKGYDSIIKQVAKVMGQEVRKEDTVSRAGLARFMISLPTSKPQGALELAKRISARVAAFKASFQGKNMPITLSIGVCTISRGQRPEMAEVIASITEALKESQLQGFGNVYAQELQGETVKVTISIDQLLRELELNGELSSEVELDHLALAIKPLVALLSKQQQQALMTNS